MRRTVRYGAAIFLAVVPLGVWSVTASEAGLQPRTAGPAPCSGVTASAAPSAPQAPGTPVQVTGSASGCATPDYEFWMLPPGAQTWQLAQPYSTTATYPWSTTGGVGGTYTFSVWARDASSPGTGGNTLGTWDAYTAYQYTLSSTPCGGVTASSSPAGSAPGGTPVTVTALASGCPGPSYQFWMLAPGAGTWQKVRAYSPTAAFNWSTGASPAGIYNFSIWARDATSAGTGRNSLGSWDSYTSLQFTVTSTPCTSHTVTTTPSGSAGRGTTVHISGSAGGCPNPRAEFWVLRPGASTWQVLQAYSTSSTYDWHTTGLPAGTYHLSVWARDVTSSGTNGNALGRWDAYCALVYTLT